jgi:hypothetical protein
MKVSSVNPKISNWQEVVDQFGMREPIGTNYRTAYEIYAEIVLANKNIDLDVPSSEPIPVGVNGTMIFVGGPDQDTVIMVECEKNNFDSANCIFNYIKMEGEQRVYEYMGTAK